MNVNEARTQWEKAAPGWAKWEDVLSHGIGSATNKMLDLADITIGHNVLDLASGAGNQTLITAKRVGENGHVVANDISSTMLQHVMENSARHGLSNISTHLGAVQELNFTPNSFDAVICRFALMLFANPEIVLSKILGALKPGGKFCVMVFSKPEENQFFVKPMQILLRNAGKKPPEGGPGLFSMGNPSILEKVFDESGFVNIEISIHNLTFELPHAKESLLMMQEAFGAYRAVISDCPEDVKIKAWEEVIACLRSFETTNGIEAPAQILIGSAQKPA